MSTTQQQYQQQLKSPQWQKRRLRELDRAGFACEACGCSEKELQVHHLKYANDHPAYVPDDWLEVLCCDCHAWRESWNHVFGRTLQPTKRLRLLVTNGLSHLIEYGERAPCEEGDALDEILGNFLRTIAGANATWSAEDVCLRHLAAIVNRRRAVERAIRNASLETDAQLIGDIIP